MPICRTKPVHGVLRPCFSKRQWTYFVIVLLGLIECDQAIIRFWTLIACLMDFLEEKRADADDPLLTCGDVRQRYSSILEIQVVYALYAGHWLWRLNDGYR